MNEPVVWQGDGSPYSARFNDRYRSCSGALAQARVVFLDACGLPERWRGCEQFTVLETGFGLGLNFLATWAAWEADAQRCDGLHFVSVEAYPVAPADILRSAQALSPQEFSGPPNKAEASSPGSEIEARLLARVPLLAHALAGVWHDLSPGVHRFDFADGHVKLTLAVGEVLAMLQALSCQADAVYLDGFSPALNPDMWSSATLQAVADHCRPGTQLASYTVASGVRLALQQIGFQVEKRPGLPPKRHRLWACFPQMKSPEG